jgi:phosphatidylserine/phosphatidylglycerophosphate/cardiolipin synthase-like enzyme
VRPRATRPAAGAALAFLLAASPAWGGHALHPAPPADTACPVRARFSPHGGAEALVAETLRQARERVRVAIYGLTSASLEAALAELARTGVPVTLKTDHIQSTGRAQAAALGRLRAAGVTVEVSRASRLLHHKFAVVDGRWVITGSFNWTAGAEHRNRENVLVFDCPALAAAFEAEWETIAPTRP